MHFWRNLNDETTYQFSIDIVEISIEQLTDFTIWNITRVRNRQRFWLNI